MIRTLAALLVLVPALALAAPPEGKWQGAIALGTVRLRMGLDVTKRADGTLAATLVSLDQGTPDLVADRVSFSGGTLEADFTRSDTHFQGTITGSDLSGAYKQAGRAFPLVLEPVADFPVLARPQEPKRPFPYVEQEVTVTVPRSPGSKDSVTLSGTLTLPKGKGPFPAVLFVGGTQPVDRDGWIARHRPLLVVSDALTRAGIVTLRFDDRGVGKSGSTRSTLAVAAGDTLTELELLVHRPEVDGKRVGLVSSSEGSVTASMVAGKSALPRFLVFLAGVGVSGKQVLAAQQDGLMRAVKLGDALLKRNRVANDKLWAILESEPDDAKVAEKLGVALADDSQMLAMMQAQVSHGATTLRDWLRTEPKDYLVKVKVPVLAMGGDLDLQVDTATNLAAISAALERGGNTHVETAHFAGLNHLFQHARSGLPKEYLDSTETLAREVTAKLRAFVLARH